MSLTGSSWMAPVGGAPFEWTNTPILDRVNDYIRFNQVITMPTQFTCSIWFRTDSYPASQFLFAGNAATGYCFIGSGGNLIGVAGSTGLVNYTVPTLAINTWYNVMLSRDSSNVVKVYLNGVESTTSGGVISSIISFARTGQYFNGAARLGGNVNEIAIWHNVVGNGTNAVDLYNGGAGAFAYDVIPSPLLYLRCNEGTGTVLTDLGTGATNADLVNVTGTYWGTH